MTTTRATVGVNDARRAGVGRIALASLVGTAIEFYDFYIFGTAAALVFGPMFFPKSAPAAQTLNAYRHVRHRLPRAADRLVPVRPFRRPHRAQIDARRLAAGDGRGDDADRLRCRPTRRRQPRAECALPSCASGRASGLAANGAARRCSRPKTRREGKRGWFGMFPQLGPSIGFLIATGLFFCCRSSASAKQLP